jgi:DNA-binding transcriptional ArsR family regulator
METIMRAIPFDLWRTCRILACRTRLKLLREIIAAPGRCVEHLAAATGISPSTASIQLSRLCQAGFVTAHRRGQTVWYDTFIPHAPRWVSRLQKAVCKSIEDKTPLDDICREATGFTHPRRIELAARIAASPMTLGQLDGCTKMSRSSLMRHLRKLRDRDYVLIQDETVELGRPAGHLANALLQIIKNGAEE